jgi:hypothetical protein
VTLRLVPAIPKQEPKAWYETPLAASYFLGGLAQELFTLHLVPKSVPVAENDRDHCKW